MAEKMHTDLFPTKRYAICHTVRFAVIETVHCQDFVENDVLNYTVGRKKICHVIICSMH